MVVTYRRQMSAVSKSTNGCPPLSLLCCLRSNCWYQIGFSVKEPVKAEFVFIAIATRRMGALLKMFFFNELVLSGRYDECLCQSLQIIVFYRSISEHVHSLFLIIILESNTTSVKWTIHNSTLYIGVVANHVKLGLALISRSLFFIFGYNFSEVEKKSIPNLPYNMKTSGLLSSFILLVKKGSDWGLVISSGSCS